MAKILELDNHYDMTPKQTLERALRENLDKVVIIGSRKEEGLTLFMSEMDDIEAFWALHKAADSVFDG